MPRDLGKKNNIAVIEDAISNSNIEFHYRTPKTSELQEYYTALYLKEDGEVKSNGVNARVAFAKKLIIGIRDGDFTEDGAPVSSDPQSEHYKENWKDLIEESSADLLDYFILFTFDKTRLKVGQDLPLSKNSGD